ncbi:MAG: hypothetical protein IPL62_18615 [Caulobacteraceae bacterium]|nr:hypothetical protein [Caulobacteraceae bacterium]
MSVASAGTGDPADGRIYCAVLIAASLAQTALWLVASRSGGRLLAGGVTWRERGFRTLRALSPAIALAVMCWGRLRLDWCWAQILPVASVVLARPPADQLQARTHALETRR